MQRPITFVAFVGPTIQGTHNPDQKLISNETESLAGVIGRGYTAFHKNAAKTDTMCGMNPGVTLTNFVP